LSIKTSELLKLKLDADLPQKHIDSLHKALVKRDFEQFAEIVTKESNQLHAICLDTSPAIFYMNTTSKNIANRLKDLNHSAARKVAAYSIDAGFHVFVFVQTSDTDLVMQAL
jgi:diphosphomevalonate decarboxylase